MVESARGACEFGPERRGEGQRGGAEGEVGRAHLASGPFVGRKQHKARGTHALRSLECPLCGAKGAGQAGGCAGCCR